MTRSALAAARSIPTSALCKTTVGRRRRWPCCQRQPGHRLWAAAITTLSAPAGSSDPSISVTDGAAIASTPPGNYYIVIDSEEEMEVTKVFRATRSP